MGKLFLIAATCLLAMSIGTLLVEGAKHNKHKKKSAAHLKTKAGPKEAPTGPSGEELYNDATALVSEAEKCLVSFDTPGKHVAAATAVHAAYEQLDKVIKSLIKAHPKHPKAPKAGEVAITQQFELGDDESHHFDGHNLSHGTLKKLEKEAKAVSDEANKLKGKNKLKAADKKKFHTDVQKLITEVGQVESELGIREELAGQEKSEFDFFDGDDPEE